MSIMTKEDIKKLISANKSILEKYKVRSIALFGSYVRDEQEEGSDIDFLVDFEEPSYENLINLAFFLEELFHKKVELIPEGGISPYIDPYIRKELEVIEIP